MPSRTATATDPAPLVCLYTDFGWGGFYVGQMHAVLAAEAPAARVVDLMHDAPRFAPGAAAHLLSPLIDRLPAGAIIVGVIDPGVGTARAPVVVEAEGRWLVGPDNGLFDVIAARAARPARRWRITAPSRESATFHGRDLFAPVAAALARGEPVPGEPMASPDGAAAGADRAGVIYIDDFGNAMTGLRAPRAPGTAMLEVADRRVPPGRTFDDVAPGAPLWLVNSVGLVEVAVNQGSARSVLGLEVGTPVRWAGGER